MIPAFLADRENRKRRGEFDVENRVGASVGMHGDFDFNGDVDEDDDEVIQCKGSSPPPQPSPMDEAKAQMELERQRALLAQQEADRKAAIEAKQKAELRQKAIGKQNTAYNTASDYATRQSRARGFDDALTAKYGLNDLYMTDVDTVRQGIDDYDINPMSSYNTKTMFNNALETALGTYRGDIKKQFNSYVPESVGYDTFADTSDDEILKEILESGRLDAMATIDAAKARGQLNDAGYARALSKMGKQGEAAMADLQDLGLGVLSGYRKDLSTLRDTGLTSVNAADFANPYSMDSFQKQFDTRKNDLLGRMRGDIFRATEGQTFFDPNEIITGSGALQGFYNPTSTSTGTSTAGGANPLLDAFVTSEKDKTKAPVTNGVF